MTEAMVKHEGNGVIRTMDDAERAAKAMAASGFFPDTRAAAQAVVKVLAGQELGFGPFASMVGVSIIKGRPSIGANLMAAAVKRTGKYNYRLTHPPTDEECEIEFFEAGQSVGKSKFTMQDAEKAGLNGKDNWRQYPKNMLFARAISNGVRFYAPDIFNGATVYTPDELDAAVDEEGNAVETVSQDAPQPDPSANPDPVDEKARKAWADLCARADKVKIEHGNPEFDKITKSELRQAYDELLQFVRNAEHQAASVEAAA